MEMLMKRILFIIPPLFFMTLTFAQKPHGTPLKASHIDNSSDFVPGVILVKFKDEVNVVLKQEKDAVSTGIRSVDEILSNNGFSSFLQVFQQETILMNKMNGLDKNGLVKHITSLHNIYRFETSEVRDIRNISDLLQLDPIVEFAEPDFYVHALGNLESIPNDPLYAQQPWLVTINAPAAWDSVTGDTTQVIAIIDTGVDWTHPDLSPNIWRNADEIAGNNIDDDGNGFPDDIRGWDFINNDNNPADDNSHGTHVAGIAAAKGNNGIGITGVAWNAKIMPVKVLQSSGVGTTSGVATAVNYAANNGATVINLSLGYYSESQTLKAALENAYSSTVLVAAAGNDEYCICNDCEFCMSMFPAAYPFVLGVMANGPGTGFSNYDASGPTTFADGQEYNYEISAPGGNILSTLPYGSYGIYSGTSMAAPMVSGAVALMKSYDPHQSTETIFCRLIQGSSNGTLNIFNSFDPELSPQLKALDLNMHDTLPGGNNDGIANSGENLNFTMTIMNTGGWADSVYIKMSLQDPADTIYATVTDSISDIGDISSYGSIPSSEPLTIAIDSLTPHNTQIGVLFQIGCGNSGSVNITYIISAYRTDLLHGILDSTLVLTPDKRWIVYPWLSIETGGKIIIMPGTELDLQYAGINSNWGMISGIGKSDSMINIYGPECLWGGYVDLSYTRFNGARCQNLREGTFSHCEFYDSQLPFTASYNFYKFYDCLFKNIGFMGIDGPGPVVRCNFFQCSGFITIPTLYCNFSEMGGTGNYYYNTYYRNGGNGFIGNNFITGPDKKVYLAPPYDVIELAPNYWGTTDSTIIDEKIFDFWDGAGCAIARYQPILTQPSDSAHGIVWKVEINDIDPQDEPMDPLGEGLAKFDVYFNREMDTEYDPLLTFSAWEPYTHRCVTDFASWNADSTVWTAYYHITKETGDGINTIKVSGARDDEGWEIPPEFNNRFKFVIQAASSASLEFTATAGLNHVDLEWPSAGTDDYLGFNLYRYAKEGEALVADTARLNSMPIADTVYTDTIMVIGPTYYYFYRILGTDLQESQNSKIISAVPFQTQEGDANGDLSVNILDITTVIYKILGESPSPFFNYAADVNDDNYVNILDVVGIINIINGNTKNVKFYESNARETAIAYPDGDNIYIISGGRIAALYFELESQINPADNISGQVPGFELAFRTSGLKVKGILYSLNNKTIPFGIQELFKMQGDMRMMKGEVIFGSDLAGNYLPVKWKNLSGLDAEDIILEAHPNPFSNFLVISCFLPVKSDIELRFYNNAGNEIGTQYYPGKDAGQQSFEWNAGWLPSGIYYCLVTLHSVTGVSVSRTLKLLSIRH